MNLADNSAHLIELARSRHPADRERLLLAIADLCDGPGGAANARTPMVQGLLNSIFLELVVEAERDIRRRLAEKLADAEWCPNAVANVLALDEIEIARPIIARSPVLNDLDLVRLLVDATLDHQVEVARRPHLSQTVVGAILEHAEPAVLTALAGNRSVELAASDMAELVALSERISSLRPPLCERPDLNGRLAERLYLWVGLALRQGLAKRFNLDTQALDAVIAETMAGAPVATAKVLGDDAVLDQRLVEKLYAAGQLRPGYLIRALREGRLGVFVSALALLGKLEPRQVQLAIDSDKPELLALACAAVGIDRSVFPDILNLVRGLNRGRPGGGAESARRADTAFANVSTTVAAAAFRQGARTLHAV